MKFLRYILFPIVPIYFLVTWTRNKLYDSNLKKSTSYSFPVICVGNLSVGGTGKSPMIEYLIRLLKDHYKLATLSRGYKRQTQGFQLANAQDSAKTLGDEPFQFYNKFGKDVLVAVDANRQAGIEQLRALSNKPDVILLDDAFQHRKVQAGFNILLTSHDQLYSKDVVLPTGNLREPKSGTKRAHVIIVTKCPGTLTEPEKEQIKNSLQPLPNQLVFFSRINYSKVVYSIGKSMALKDLKDFTLVTGIAKPKPLLEFLKKGQLEFRHLKFEDHHHFTEKEIAQLATLDCILTTEKDYMRLKDQIILKDKLFYLPIEVSLDAPDLFNKAVLGFVNS
ncbi:MAG: tetraacyldisaccharide 4'-kinase [Xanthomarina gelatinilytica]|uniref:tetraacyldisaccharide 4'-kinase n=1 Tax=Xanthomarina gelatinilytica TaxID=1137281 RepID=UPI003A8BE997